jgi:nucleoside-diphosphate-sugar epimerase
MEILVVGGTKYFGIPMVQKLIEQGHKITIATRQKMQDCFGEHVERIKIERTDLESLKNAFSGRIFDVVIDKLAYCSNDIKYIMEAVFFDKYIHMSSTAIYQPKVVDTREELFDGLNKKLVWCNRSDFSYDEIKRQAECALWQEYRDRNWIAVRYPFVTSKGDYTKRLLFYIEHAIKGIPMNIDNVDSRMSLIHAREAGEFLAYLVDKDFKGAINGCSDNTVSIREILNYVETKTGKKSIIHSLGDTAPYNGEPDHCINTDKAKKLGYQFSNLNDWLWDLVDYYIDIATMIV